MPPDNLTPSDLRYIRVALTWWDHVPDRHDDEMFALHLTVRQAKWLLERVENDARER